MGSQRKHRRELERRAAAAVCDVAAVRALGGEVGFGWVTLSAMEAGARTRLMEWASGRWGAPVECAAGHGYRYGLEWVSGLRVRFGAIDGGEHSSLVADGAFCELHAPEMPGLLREWGAMGYRRSTRLDVSIDFRDGVGRELVGQVEGSCERAELAGARQYHVVRPRSARGEVLGETIYVGSRSSRFYLRVYDKGLESGTARRGEWVRWEAELKGDWSTFAVRALRRLVAREWGEDVDEGELPGDAIWNARTLRDCLLACATSGVSFVVRREGDRSVKRAAVAQWWGAFVEGVGRGSRVVTKRVAATVERFERWFRRQVARSAAEYLAALGGDVCEALDRLGVMAASARAGRLSYAVAASMAGGAPPSPR